LIDFIHGKKDGLKILGNVYDGGNEYDDEREDEYDDGNWERWYCAKKFGCSYHRRDVTV
jgi:hypothetical protein